MPAPRSCVPSLRLGHALSMPAVAHGVCRHKHPVKHPPGTCRRCCQTPPPHRRTAPRALRPPARGSANEDVALCLAAALQLLPPKLRLLQDKFETSSCSFPRHLRACAPSWGGRELAHPCSSSPYCPVGYYGSLTCSSCSVRTVLPAPRSLRTKRMAAWGRRVLKRGGFCLREDACFPTVWAGNVLRRLGG